jgi:hypothetical protein
MPLLLLKGSTDVMAESKEQAEPIPLMSARYLRPRRRLAGALVGLVLGIGILCVGPWLLGPIGVLAGLIPTFVLPIVIARHLGWKRIDRPTEMTLDGDCLTIPALDLTLKPSDVRHGIESAVQQSVVLDLAKGNESVHLHLTSKSEGERILSALGVANRTTEVPLRRTLGKFSIGLVTFICALYPMLFVGGSLRAAVGLSFGLTAAFILLVTSLITMLVVRRLGSPRVVVGNDGLQLRGLLREDFIPYASIKGVEPIRPMSTQSADMFSLAIHLENGSKRVLPMVAIGRERITGLIERIEREKRKAKGDGRTRISDALTRAGKSLGEWREELTKLATRQASFREAAFERDEIENVLADPNASPDQRIGAAYVLHRIDPEAGKERVRIAADATAAEDLRDALNEAAEGEIETAAVQRTLRA